MINIIFTSYLLIPNIYLLKKRMNLNNKIDRVSPAGCDTSVTCYWGKAADLFFSEGENKVGSSLHWKSAHFLSYFFIFWVVPSVQRATGEAMKHNSTC